MRAMHDIPEHDPETPREAESVATSAEPVGDAQPAAVTEKIFASGFTQEEIESMLGTTDSALLALLGLC
jgi:hypothetical protein